MSGPLQVVAVAVLAAICTAGAASQASEPTPLSWQEPVVVATGDGHKGPWRMNRSAFHYVDDPAVAMNAAGIIAVAWVDNRRQEIFLQRYGSAGRPRFATPAKVSRSPDVFSWLPKLVIGRGKEPDVFVLWQEIVFSGGSHGGEILFARSTDGGGSFAAPLNLSNSRPGDGKGRLTARYWDNGSLDLAMAPDGRLYAAWTEYDGRLWLARSDDRGAGFAAPRRIAGNDGAPARGPTLAVGNDGAVHLAWAVGEDRTAGIRYTRSDDGGTSFGVPEVVGSGNGRGDAPDLLIDDAGGVHLVYAEHEGGPRSRGVIRHSVRTAGAWTPPAVISQPPPIAAESAAFPTLSQGRNGHVLALWPLFQAVGNYPRGLALSRSRDGGQSFAPPRLIAGSDNPAHGFNGSQQGLLMQRLASNRSGAVAVVASTFQAGAASRIWLYLGQAGR